VIRANKKDTIEKTLFLHVDSTIFALVYIV